MQKTFSISIGMMILVLGSLTLLCPRRCIGQTSGTTVSLLGETSGDSGTTVAVPNPPDNGARRYPMGLIMPGEEVASPFKSIASLGLNETALLWRLFHDKAVVNQVLQRTDGGMSRLGRLKASRSTDRKTDSITFEFIKSSDFDRITIAEPRVISRFVVQIGRNASNQYYIKKVGDRPTGSN